MATVDAERIGRLVSNLRLLCGFRTLQMTMLPVAIAPLYWRDELNLDMSEIFAIHAIFGLFAACLEFPGGYIADRIGYRASMMIATVASVAGWAGLGLATGLWSVLAAEFCLAISLSLTSGTDAAIMYESLLELGREDEFQRWFGRSRSMGAVAEGTAALGVGILYAFSPALPFFLQTGFWFANAAIARRLVEPARQLGEKIGTLDRVRYIFHFAGVRSPKLRASIAMVTTIGFATFIPVWIIAIYADGAGLAVEWIGPMWAVANYSVAIGNYASDRVGPAMGVSGTLLLCSGLLAVGFFGLAFSHAIAGFAFYYIICLARGLNGPLLNHVQQRLIPSSDRASLLSINSLLFRATFFVLGPVIGLGMDRIGAHQVLLISGVIMVPLTLICTYWLSHVLSQPDRAGVES